MKQSCLACFLLLSLIWHSVVTVPPVCSSEEEQEQTVQATEQTTDPNTVPYKTRRSFAEQVLSLPAKIWRLVWTPIGWLVVYVETPKGKSNFIEYFVNEDRSAGFLPFLSIGDNIPIAMEFYAWDNRFFNTDLAFSAQLTYANTQNNKLKFGLADSSLFNSRLFFDTRIRIFKDSDENYFTGGNDGKREPSETSYAIDQNSATLTLGVKTDRLDAGIFGGVNDVAIHRGDEKDEGDRFYDTGIPGIGRASLFSLGLTLQYDSRKSYPRPAHGQLVNFMYRYGSEFNDHNYEYHGFRLAAVQYFSLPILPHHRRFAARAVIEKLWPINDRQIPFYELSIIGDAHTLRGFDEDRFRDLGSLLFNIEYRYPVWDYLDAVLFVDAGQVYSDFEQIALDRFHYGFGTGLRVITALGTAIRLEAGISTERIRFLLQTEKIF